jgi:hypothetical protein
MSSYLRHDSPRDVRRALPQHNRPPPKENLGKWGTILENRHTTALKRASTSNHEGEIRDALEEKSFPHMGEVSHFARAKVLKWRRVSAPVMQL